MNYKRALCAVLLMVGVTLTSTGCSAIQQAMSGTDYRAQNAWALVAQADAAPTTAPAACLQGYDKCFTSSDQMQSFYATMIGWVREWSAASYSKMPDVKAWYYIPRGRSLKTPCVDNHDSHVSDDSVYQYCRADDSVYVGEAVMWSWYRDFGDAPLAIGLVHEFGHHVQYVGNGIDPGKDVSKKRKNENQADCISGAWANYATSRGMFGTSDLDTVKRFISTRLGSDVPGMVPSLEQMKNGSDHGTTAERTDAFMRSYAMSGATSSRAIAACNDLGLGPVMG